jgi:hypothetical protein
MDRGRKINSCVICTMGTNTILYWMKWPILHDFYSWISSFPSCFSTVIPSHYSILSGSVTYLFLVPQRILHPSSNRSIFIKILPVKAKRISKHSSSNCGPFLETRTSIRPPFKPSIIENTAHPTTPSSSSGPPNFCAAPPTAPSALNIEPMAPPLLNAEVPAPVVFSPAGAYTYLFLSEW